MHIATSCMCSTLYSTHVLRDVVCHDVTVEPEVEPHLQSLTGEAMALQSANKGDAVHLNISACGV